MLECNIFFLTPKYLIFETLDEAVHIVMLIVKKTHKREEKIYFLQKVCKFSKISVSAESLLG